MADTKSIPGNPDHPGISAVIPLILLGGIILFFFIFYRLLPFLMGGEAREYVIINGLLAVFSSLLLIRALDPVLKRVWPSGYAVRLEDGGLLYSHPEKVDHRFDLTRPFNLTCWYFKMAGYTRYGRERQIKRGTYCVACQVQQDEERVVLYCFVPEAAAGERIRGPFLELDMGEIYDTGLAKRFQQWRMPGGRPELPSGLIVSDRGRYWLAERNRWSDGVELQPNDFSAVVEHILQFEPQLEG